MRFAVTLALLLAAFAPAYAQDENTAFDWAVEAILRNRAQGDLNTVAYRVHEFEVQGEDDKQERRFAYDPGLTGLDRLMLISANGETPTQEEAQDFAEDRLGEEGRPLQVPTFDDDWGDVDESQLRTQLAFKAWQEGIAVFSFIDGVPVTATSDDDSFSRQIDGELHVAQDTTGRAFVKALLLFSSKPFKPNVAVKVKEFSTRLGFGVDTASGLVLPTQQTVRTIASAFFRRFEVTQEVTYSDFEVRSIPEPAEPVVN